MGEKVLEHLIYRDAENGTHSYERYLHLNDCAQTYPELRQASFPWIIITPNTHKMSPQSDRDTVLH